MKEGAIIHRTGAIASDPRYGSFLDCLMRQSQGYALRRFTAT